MPISFELPEEIANQTSMVRMLAEQVMRSISRHYDDNEHKRPWEFINVIWPFIQQVEAADLKRSMKRHTVAAGDASARNSRPAKRKVDSVGILHREAAQRLDPRPVGRREAF